MSIRKMISLHPQADGHVNEPLAQALRHTADCALICTACAEARLAEPGDMRQGIRTCLDCADICGAAARILVRRTGDDHAILRTILRACVEACEICAAECARHDHDHCRMCAETCRECADDCRAALATVG